MSEFIVEAQDVVKTYAMGRGGLRVLKGVSLGVRFGETMAIIGPSGAGKSTLLHIMGGLDAPTGGRVLFKGEDIVGLSPQKCAALRATEIGFVFQSYHLLPELDVLENVMLPAMSRRKALWSHAQSRKRALSLLETVGLQERARHTPMELSGGEQQRVALARALMNEPDLVLADEPTGNLDTATGLQVLQCLFALTRERRHTLVLVTHNAELASRCDRCVTLVDGLVAGER